MQANLKHSRQREALITLLNSVKTHPTAQWLYDELKKEFPSISLATVYRNLNLLCRYGNAVRIEVGDGADHFDATTANHYHFFCKKCHKVVDVSSNDYLDINGRVADEFKYDVESHHVVFHGLCDKCKSKK